jgi:hypothetical protein
MRAADLMAGRGGRVEADCGESVFPPEFTRQRFLAGEGLADKC